MVKNTLLTSVLALSISTFLVNGNAFADNTSVIATESFSGSIIGFSEQTIVKNSTLSISGPNGFYASKANKDTIPSINLAVFGELTDGRYKYQITSSDLDSAAIKITSPINNGRDDRSQKPANRSISQTGYFYLEAGQVKHFPSINSSPAR
jgi:hypothetical protein